MVNILLTILFILFAVSFVFIAFLYKEIKLLTQRLILLSNKVRDGENVIIENFGIVEKRLVKLEHEIKNSYKAKIKETISQVRRIRDKE